MGRLKYEREIEKSNEERRAVFVSLAWRCARNESLPLEEIEAACLAAGKSVPDFRALVERCVARKKAASDLAEAAKLAGEQAQVGERLEKAHAAVRAAEEHVEELRREQMAVLGESSLLSNRVNSLRSAATATLQSSADPTAADPLDPANVRIDDAPQSAALPAPSFGSWHPGESAVLPRVQFVSRAG